MTPAPDDNDAFATLGDRIERLRVDEFVGRAFEQHFFEEYLTRLPDRTERILNVHGTGGMGKTVLLGRFRAIAEEWGASFVYVDLRQVAGRTEHIAAFVRDQTGRAYPQSMADAESGRSAHGIETSAAAFGSPDSCAEPLNRIAVSRRIVLAFDHYEEIGSLDAWLRDSLLPMLHTNILIVIAGRYPLEGPWRLSPAWRKLVVALPLSEWSYDDARVYLTRCGITDETAADRLWIRTFGHPLSLAMAVSASPGTDRRAIAPASPTRPERLDERFEELVRHWLREAPDDELRELVMAASVTRSFQQESLSAMTGRDISPSLFDRLVKLSFVERSLGGGWRMHELARETVLLSFRERFPDRFAQYRSMTVRSLRERIAAALREGQDITREAAELLGQIGNPILRAHFRHSRASRNYWETVSPHNAEEAETYVRSRASLARDSVIRCSDPETGQLFRFSLTAAQSLQQLSPASVSELVRHGGEHALRLLRSPAGEAVGLVAMLPIHAGTLPFLMNAPASRAYFHSLPAERLAPFQVPPRASVGKFLYYADVADPEKEELRSDVVRLKLEHMLAGALLVASPPNVPYYAEAYRSLGFMTVPGAEHADYDGRTLTPAYVLDTRGSGGMISFLNRVTESSEPFPSLFATEQSAAASLPDSGDRTPSLLGGVPASTATLHPLTPREREVAGLLALGHTNGEIASALYMSVAAVKKHVNAMLHKYGVRNRTQLAQALSGIRPGSVFDALREPTTPFSSDV
ncbi:LuxR family transcriptional regulator [Paenibacillus mesophilus]|uniref:LuxR C-terminal-related transcriptional regulator n=1 Tax=Paenibacillus mesophilus TaxID=2582849 RepID=UPI00110D4C7D|nr:LuxR C-terminal-related transcriptional regulator [Paenibacillus mesophilus]TMV49652.1 LuxR family transcriptional regulator [Paenibacillus mesophilus]